MLQTNAVFPGLISDTFLGVYYERKILSNMDRKRNINDKKVRKRLTKERFYLDFQINFTDL